MLSTGLRLVTALQLLSQVHGAILLASHYTGEIHTLSLTTEDAEADFAITSSASGCGILPAWLQWDSDTGTLYCIDESWFGSGVAASFSADADGRLTQTGRTTTSGGSVHSTLYGGEDGRGFLATSEYDRSTITTYKLPLGSRTKVQQQLKFNLTTPGPHPRQEAPHPHASFPDPTGRYLLVPDLGADLIRIFSIHAVSGELADCGAGRAEPGDGPRHGAFWAPIQGSTEGLMLYTVNELGNSVSAWSVSYPAESPTSGCLTLSKTQTLSTYAEGISAPAGSKASEVHVKDNFLYAANRADETFGAEKDSLATYAIDAETGEIAWLEAANAHAWYPRTFAINAAGDLVAVGGQTSSNVAVIARDPATGRLGNLITSLQVASRGNPGNEDGLSAVIWLE
ncbi:hypothetical protein DL764_010010 [Monosporascus ibericus]|uniref:6-phosphogluconolactonase n=1 Tax=Monosporascus ibericus TaxID=155417 RepID=A0A4Q4SVH4_9PEZI|nr:hypothetical protein DL764_010010 [Monosporascus ibericus]